MKRSYSEIHKRPSAASAIPRIASIDGLRGIACLAVVIGHFFVQKYEGILWKISPLLQTVCDKYVFGVDLFFVLSGFLIGGILLDHRNSSCVVKAFYLRRIIRIWPLYYLLVIPIIGTQYLYGHPAHCAPFWPYLFFLHTFWTSAGYSHVFIAGVLWSIAIEEQFYLVAPFVLKRTTMRQAFWVITAAIVGSVLCRLLLQTGVIHFDLGGTLSKADTIGIGLFGAFLLRNERALAVLSRPGVKLGTLPLLLVIAGWMMIHTGPDASWLITWLLPDVAALSFLAVLLLVTLHQNCGLARSLRTPFLTIPGKYCYFIYLFHVVILVNFELLIDAGYLVNGVAVRLIAMAATLAAAAFSWRWIESPMIAWAKRKWDYEETKSGSQDLPQAALRVTAKS